MNCSNKIIQAVFVINTDSLHKLFSQGSLITNTKDRLRCWADHFSSLSQSQCSSNEFLRKSQQSISELASEQSTAVITSLTLRLMLRKLILLFSVSSRTALVVLTMSPLSTSSSAALSSEHGCAMSTTVFSNLSIPCSASKMVSLFQSSRARAKTHF